jgi:hypothetical protein
VDGTSRKILEKISDEVQDSKFDFTIISKAVRDESQRQKISTRRSAIDFVLKALLISGHSFEPDLPQTARALAEAFWNSVSEGLRRKGIVIDPAIEKELREHLSGGLLNGKASGGIVREEIGSKSK